MGITVAPILPGEAAFRRYIIAPSAGRMKCHPVGRLDDGAAVVVATDLD